MRIVIVGDGKVGSALAQLLSEEGHDITLIDRNSEVLDQTSEEQDVLVVKGNGAAINTQKEAHVGKSDLLIAATSGDELNLLCCMLAKKLGCPHTIARVRNPEYMDQAFLLKDELGLNMVVNPERAAAGEIFRILQFPSFLHRDTFSKGRVEIVEIKLDGKSPLIGKKLFEIEKIIKVQTLICSVERGDKVYIPGGDFVLKEGDRIFVTAPAASLAKLIRNLKLDQKKIHDVIIIGGSRTAYYLASNLIESGVKVKIIEHNLERCRELAEYLSKATIIHANGSERSVLDSEGVPVTDAVVSLTDIDEENLLISKYADLCRVPTVITKLNRTEFDDLYDLLGIKWAISPKMLISADIVRYVRAMQNTEGDEVITLHRIGKMEALEFMAHDFSGSGVKLKDLDTADDVLIACINRRGHIILPGGNDTIEEGDTVIVVTTPDNRLTSLEAVLADGAS